MLGMMEGTNVAAHIPQILRRVCDAPTIIRLQNIFVV